MHRKNRSQVTVASEKMVNVGSALILLLPAILSSFISFTSQHQLNDSDPHRLIEEAKLHVSRLESAFDEVNTNVKDRDIHLLQMDNRILDLEKARNDLESSLSSMKEECLALSAENKIIALEEEARILWASLRKNNFDLHVMQSKVREAEDRLKVLSLRAETMQAIVNEQWVQIQHFEQALLLGEMRLAKIRHQIRSSRCTFLKYMNSFSDNYLQEGHKIYNSLFWAEGSSLRSYLSQASDQLQGLYSIVKEFHHKLQRIVKGEMERHQLTANLANEELVFFVASALIVFPILSAWMWLSSQLH